MQRSSSSSSAIACHPAGAVVVDTISSKLGQPDVKRFSLTKTDEAVVALGGLCQC